MAENVERAPVVLTLIRSRQNPRCVLVDENLNLYSFDELRHWDYRRGGFVVIDPDTGEDITRVLLA